MNDGEDHDGSVAIIFNFGVMNSCREIYSEKRIKQDGIITEHGFILKI